MDGAWPTDATSGWTPIRTCRAPPPCPRCCRVGRRPAARTRSTAWTTRTARERITQDVNVNGSDGCHGVTVEWETIQISGVGNVRLDRPWSGDRHERGGQRAHAGGGVLRPARRDELATTMLQHVGHEENVRAIMVHPTHMGGSDGILVGDRPHPRAWGTFPRYLAHYIRDSDC